MFSLPPDICYRWEEVKQDYLANKCQMLNITSCLYPTFIKEILSLTEIKPAVYINLVSTSSSDFTLWREALDMVNKLELFLIYGQDISLLVNDLPLRSLRINNYAQEKGQMITTLRSILPIIPQLECLSCTLPANHEFLRELEDALERNDSLRSISIGIESDTCTELEGILKVLSFKRLRTFSISSKNLTPEVAESIAALRSIKKLILDIGNGITHLLSSLVNNESIEILHLNDCFVDVSSKLLADLIQRNKNLRTITVKELDDPEIIVETLENNDTLQTFIFDGYAVPDNYLTARLIRNNRHLTTLGFSHNSAYDDTPPLDEELTEQGEIVEIVAALRDYNWRLLCLDISYYTEDLIYMETIQGLVERNIRGWSPEEHLDFPPFLRTQVYTLMSILSLPKEGILSLPKEVLFAIFIFL